MVLRKDKLNCSLVIRCYNEEQHIGRLLTGVAEQTVEDVEILVVDSGSTDATLSIASRFPVKIFSIKPDDFSFGKSLNIGCRAATKEFVVMASAHVYPLYKDWLKKLLEPFKDHEVALVYGKQRGNRTTKYSEQQIFKKWFPDSSVNNQDHPFCNNANAVIRKSVWNEIPYNEKLTGLEDLDWAKRVIDSGKRIIYCAEAEVIHVHNETLKNIYNRYRREAIAFKRIYPHEGFNLWHFMRLFCANVLTDCYHAKRDRQLLKNLFSIPSFRCMHFWGTYMGYRQHGVVPRKLWNRFYYPNGLFRNHDTNSEDKKDRLINYEHH